MQNWTQRQWINVKLRISKYRFNTNTMSTSSNQSFHSHTSQLVRQYRLHLWTNNLMTLYFTVLIKHFIVCQTLMVFNIEEIKEAYRFNFLYQNVGIAIYIYHVFYLLTMSIYIYIYTNKIMQHIKYDVNIRYGINGRIAIYAVDAWRNNATFKKMYDAGVKTVYE